MKTIKVSLPKNKKERLEKLAIRYGFSLEDLSAKILGSIFSDIEEESWDNYDEESKKSFKRGLSDLKHGRVRRVA